MKKVLAALSLCSILAGASAALAENPPAPSSSAAKPAAKAPVKKHAKKTMAKRTAVKKTTHTTPKTGMTDTHTAPKK